MKKLGREIIVKVVHNSSKMSTTTNYSLGGVMTIMRRKCILLIDYSKIVKGLLGNWLAIPLSMNNECAVLINVCRIPASSQ